MIAESNELLIEADVTSVESIFFLVKQNNALITLVVI
jgi:hypothetical protein